MGDRKSSKGLGDFEKRLNATKKSIEDRDRQVFNQGSAYSFGFRLVTDLVVGVLSGVGIGWLLDYLLGTAPWLLLVFMPLGMIAGILNVIRAAKSVEATRHLEKTDATGIPSVPFDDDE
ncbi:MAG TPA: F0F1 ATP synthase subunit I [Rhizobiales bacterium]|nr:F0F1 ATP synthase subunit I [Hyphomicrobiales bacterium]